MFSKTNTFLFVALVLLVVALWSCSDDDGGTPNDGGALDHDPPTVTSVTAVNYREVEIVFSEAVDKTTAERPENYGFSEVGPLKSGDDGLSGSPALPGDPLEIRSVTLGSDGRTVKAATDAMADVLYGYSVTGVKDLNGNTMTVPSVGTFDGSLELDTTRPEIIARSPSPGATGVGLGQSVVIQFSEPVATSTLAPSISWTWSGGSVLFEIDVVGSSSCALRQLSPLEANTLYTVRVDTTVTDQSGNFMAAAVTWSFRTTRDVDDEPPTLVSSTPSDGQTGVPVGTNFVLVFSEPIDQTREFGVLVTPNPGDGIPAWSPDGTTITLDPFENLASDQQYTVVIPQGGVFDLAGNGLADPVTIVFTTGSSLATGGISGTLSGDPGSTQADSPEGAVVLAATENVFSSEGDPPIAGATVAAANGDYTLSNLPNDTYYPAAILDSNQNGLLDPEFGDAIGLFGVDIDQIPPDTIPASVTVTNVVVANVDFRLFDFSVVSGYVFYDGTDHTSQLYLYDYYAGLFDTTGFDPGSIPDPDFGTDREFSIVHEPHFYVGNPFNSVPAGTYYVGAFMDVNFNGNYNPAVDPAGFYTNGGNLVPVTVADDSDILDVIIHLDDPQGGGGGGGGSAWRSASRREIDLTRRGERLTGVIRRALSQPQP